MAENDFHPDILAMASGLGICDQSNPVEGIVNHCLSKIGFWVEEHSVQSIASLEQLVCKKLQLVIHEIETDEVLQELKQSYLSEGEIVIAATLEDELSGANFATLFERAEGITALSPDRYVAFVDCRTEERKQRRFFTRWHEIAHVLTFYRKLDVPHHRSYRADNDEAEERLMDLIASRIGFYPDLFDPFVHCATRNGSEISFSSVSAVIQTYAAEASFDATLNAMLRIVVRPVIKLRLEDRFKAKEKREVDAGDFLIPEVAPKPTLRTAEVLLNEAARERDFRIHRNMRVPQESVIARVHHNGDGSGSAYENLDWWSSSQGGALREKPVYVEAQFVGGRLFALISCDC